MTHNLTPQQLDMLRQIQAGADPLAFPARQLNTLIKGGFLVDVPGGLGLTEAGLNAVQSAAWYVLQQAHGRVWVPIAAERPTPDLQAAERRAAQYSVQSEALIRVVPEGVDPATFTVFEFGKRYTQDAVTGARIAEPGFRQTHDNDRDPGGFYVIQKRIPHHQNEGTFGAWQLVSERQYVDPDLANADASQIAAEGQAPLEYRVTHAEAVDLPPLVYYRGETLPDLGVLDQLARIGAGRMNRPEPLSALKQAALGRMIGDWALHDPRHILTVCAEALDNSDLSRQVRRLRDSL